MFSAGGVEKNIVARIRYSWKKFREFLPWGWGGAGGRLVPSLVEHNFLVQLLSGFQLLDPIFQFLDAYQHNGLQYYISKLLLYIMNMIL